MQLDFSNWRRDGSGEWAPTEQRSCPRTLETPVDARTQAPERSDLMDA